MKRLACVALAACLLIAPTGCRLSQEVAAERAGRVHVGMTRADVNHNLGEPDTRVYNLHDGAEEVWDYRCGQDLHPNPLKVVLGVVVILGLVALAVAMRGNIPSFGDSSKREGNYGVRVHFDGEAGVVQRVIVTPPQ